MDDFSEKLAGILNDPESMERVRMMAESLLGDSNEKNAAPVLPRPVQSAPSGGMGDLLSAFGDGMPDAATLKKIMGIISKFKSVGNDDRSALLLALRPHLSEPRKEKLDTAMKILRLIDILPYLKESGLLN